MQETKTTKPTTAIDFPRVGTNKELITFLDTVPQNIISLVPDMYNFVRRDLKIGFQRVKVNIETDTYSMDNGKTFALNAKKLKELALATGVAITNPVIMAREPHSDGRVGYIKHKVSWEFQAIDGSLKCGDATGEYNYLEDLEYYVYKYDVYAKDEKGKYKKDAQGNNIVVAKKGDKQWSIINQRRRKAGQLAETNACVRAIANALPKLKATYTSDELSEGILVPCVVQDMNDMLKEHPELEKAFLAKQLGLIQNNSVPILAEESTVEPINKKNDVAQPVKEEVKQESKPEIEDAKVVEEPKKEGLIKEGNFPPGMSDEEKAKEIALSYKDSKQSERTKKIEDLIKQKGYKRANPQTKIETYSVDKQIELIEKLLLMQDEI